MHKIRNCTISQLQSNQRYLIYATSSTVLGRSDFSSSISVKTLESSPQCQPTSFVSSNIEVESITLEWEPSLNSSKQNEYWLYCLGGDLKNFSLYQIILLANNTSIDVRLYTGLENSYSVVNLNSSTTYEFRVDMCNNVGCISSERLNVTTLDPLPNKWSERTKPK